MAKARYRGVVYHRDSGRKVASGIVTKSHSPIRILNAKGKEIWFADDYFTLVKSTKKTTSYGSKKIKQLEKGIDSVVR